MKGGDSTCWTVVRDAAEGKTAAREEFVRRYASSVRAYLQARWGDTLYRQEVEDAVQETFLECFRTGGAIDRADRARTDDFRAFLFAITRNVALRVEDRRRRRRDQVPPETVDLEEVAADDDSLSRIFDRAWATTIVRQAADLQEERASTDGDEAQRRVELLRLRFYKGLPIREIARQWGEEPDKLHHQYARARREFKAALLDVVAFHHPSSPSELQEKCAEILALLA